MPFRRYVSIGRVAYVNLAEDPLYGKLVVIVDVVDQNRVRTPPTHATVAHDACSSRGRAAARVPRAGGSVASVPSAGRPPLLAARVCETGRRRRC